MVVFIPYEKFVIKTDLSSSEIKQKLSEVIEPYKMIRYIYSYDHKPYDGEIIGDNFKIRRVPDYRNRNFVVIVEGKIRGSSIECIIRNDWGLVILMIFCFSSLGAMMLSGLFIRQKDAQYGLWLPCMFIAGYLGVMIAFYTASKESKRFLSELFKSKIT